MPESGGLLSKQDEMSLWVVGNNDEITVKTQEYAMCVPNEAIYEVVPGITFVYILEDRQSVLGNYQIAVEISVDVIARDETYAAIDRNITPNDNIIVFSDRMFSGGDRVRSY